LWVRFNFSIAIKMDKKILAELILDNKRLIIPNLGAFLHKESGKEGRAITFSPFLRYNDGLLEELLVQKLSIPKSEVILLVKRLSDEIQANLNDSGQYTIPGIGVLALDSKGTVYLIESNEKSSVTVNDNTTKIIEKTDTPITIELIEEKGSNTDDPIGKNPEFVDLSEPTDSKSTLVIDERDEPFIKAENNSNVDLLDETTDMKKTQHPHKKKRLPVTLIFFIASLAVIIAFAFIIRELAFAPDEDTWQQEFKQENIIEPIKFPESATSSNDEIDKAFENAEVYSSKSESNETKLNDSNTETIIEENLTGKPKSNNPASGVYSIVMGSFTNPNNAKQFAHELKGKGFAVEVISQPNNKNIVVIGQFNTREQAEKMKKDISPTYPGVWIIKR